MHAAAPAVATPISPEEAARLGEGLRDLSWRQAPAYAAHAARDIGADCEFVALSSGGERFGVAAVRLKTLPLTRLGIAYVAQGPAVSPAGAFDAARFGAAVEALRTEYVHRRGLVLRIQPPLYAGGHQPKIAAIFAAHGFAPLHRPPYRTILLDLAPPLDQLRARLNGKWRTELSRAERQGISVTRTNAVEGFERFLPLFDQLAARKGFSAAQDAAFFTDLARAAKGQPDDIVVHLAEHDGACIAGHVGSFSGDTAVYLLGAADPKGRELRASYLLQWAVIEHARSLGQAIYDLGGIDEAANPDVFKFKSRMGGAIVEAAAGFELAPGAWAGRAVRAAEAARALVGRLRRQ